MASIVDSVEKVSVTFDANSEPVTTNLSKGQDYTQCVPFVTARWATAPGLDVNYELHFNVEIIDNSGTAAVKITSTDRTETDDTVAEVFVVEFASTINVQQIAVTTALDTDTVELVTITDVGATTSAFAIYYPEIQAITDNFDDGCVRVSFNSTTQVQLTRQSTGGDGDWNGTLYVVDCDSGEFTVEHNLWTNGPSTDNSDTQTITSVTMADTFLIHTYYANPANDDLLDCVWHAELTNANTVTVRRNSSGNDGTPISSTFRHSVQVVECQNSEWDVQRETSFVLDGATATDTITAIDQTRSIIIGGHGQGSLTLPRADSTVGQDRSAQAYSIDFSANDTVRAIRASGAATDSVVAYEVVQFDVPSSGEPRGAGRGIARGVMRGVG